LALQRLVDWRDVAEVIEDGLSEIEDVIEDEILDPIEDLDAAWWLEQKSWGY